MIQFIFQSNKQQKSHNMSSYYMELLEEPLNFPPVSKEINVFFDECNRQVFAVSTQGLFCYPNFINFSNFNKFLQTL